MSEFKCPECAGGWMENFRFDHTLQCGLRAQLDQTHSADIDRMHPPGRIYLRIVRASTPAEIRLLEAFGRAPSDNPMTRVTARTTHVVKRTVDGFDPDKESNA